jgi:DNA polymerase-3 subunit epsilon
MRLRRPRDEAAVAFDEAGRPARGTPWLEAGWCALDLELTGLDPRSDEIIAVGAVPIDEGRVILGKGLYTLVRSTRRSEHAAILAHKLRVQDLADAPEAGAALDLVFEVLAGRVPVFHVGSIERSFLSPLFAERRLRLPAAADTDILGRIWMHERDGVYPRRLPLAKLAEELGQQPEIEHHALGDALTTAEAFIALASHLDARSPQTVGSLLNADQQLRVPSRLG